MLPLWLNFVILGRKTKDRPGPSGYSTEALRPEKCGSHFIIFCFLSMTFLPQEIIMLMQQCSYTGQIVFTKYVSYLQFASKQLGSCHQNKGERLIPERPLDRPASPGTQLESSLTYHYMSC